MIHVGRCRILSSFPGRGHQSTSVCQKIELFRPACGQRDRVDGPYARGFDSAVPQKPWLSDGRQAQNHLPKVTCKVPPAVHNIVGGLQNPRART